MKKLIGLIFATMTVIAVVYCNYHAVRESKPFFTKARDRLTGSKAYTKISGLVGRVTDSNIVQGTKTKVSNAGGRVVHMFKRREHVA